MDKAIRDFLQYITFEKHYSKNTQESYRTDLLNFEKFLLDYFGSQKIFWKRVSKKIIRYYLVNLQEQEIARRSIARKLATVKTFFKFLVRESVIEQNPTLTIKIPKFEKKLPEYLSTNETESLFQLPDLKSFEGLRDLAILEFFYGTGIRLSELLNLKTNDIYFDEDLIRVIGKGNKERIIPFGSSSKRILTDYIAMRTQYVRESVDNVFILKSGNKMYPMAVQRIIKNYISKISEASQKSPHLLRHTYATHLLNAGASIRTVKDLLGHESLSTTQVYTHMSIDHLKKIYNRAHPGASKK